MNELTTYHCPIDRRAADDVTGCGAVFDAAPDEAGEVDCPNCGMWFTPARELCAEGEHVDVEDGRCLLCGEWMYP
jgi:hypothetical protein